ncbi:MAG: rhomboid family intramembrane serine protease [Methylococcales bacterium]|nr:rhomboid family intramembrane serine protease [Methylococcales bacterium]
MIPIHDDNPVSITPYITYLLILSCILVFFWELSLAEQLKGMFFSLGVVPATLVGIEKLPAELLVIPAWLSIFTSMFMHGSWMHLLSNILYLWVFGNNIEDAMGHGRFLLFYLLCGVVAVFSQVLPEPASIVPMIGASGAISGILGAYLLLYPRAQILVAIPLGIIFFTQRLSAFFVLLFWFAMQLFSSYVSGEQQGGVAFGAHIGGFVAGMVLIIFFRNKHQYIYFFGNRY